MTQENESSQPSESRPTPLEYRGPVDGPPTTDPGARWFGYIGVGIMIAAILVGIAGMIWLCTLFLGRM